MKIKICFILCVVWLALFNNAAMSDSLNSINASPFSIGSLTTVSDKGLGIHNGEEVPSFSSAPFMAQLEIRLNNNNGYCGSVFIKSNYLLTAAHCLMDFNGNEYANSILFVRYGGVDRDQPKTFKVVPVIDYKIYPNFVPRTSKYGVKLSGDVAVLKIEKRLFSKIKPIKILDINSATKYFTPGALLDTYGWGATNYKTTTSSKKLNHIQIEYADISEIYNIINASGYKTSKWDPLTMIGTVSAYGKVTDVGDSGGPLIVVNPKGKKFLVGITSSGLNNGVLSMFANISTNLNIKTWISTVIKN